MRYLILSLLFASAAAAAQNTMPVLNTSAPLVCPECGVWTLTNASSGASGEFVSISPGWVEVPTLGKLCTRTVAQTAKKTGDGHQYTVSLMLAPGVAECLTPSPDELRLEVFIQKGFSEEGSLAHFTIFAPGQRAPAFEAAGWNGERESPCDGTGSSPASTCMALQYASVYKRLAYSSCLAQLKTAPRAGVASARRFNHADFAHDVEAYCDKRERDSGARYWPKYWSFLCQTKRLEAKLVEFDRWHACTKHGTVPCNIPNRHFKRSEDAFP